jgi:hypothetical protein
VLRATRETETIQGNIEVWLELDEYDPGFQLLIVEEIKNSVALVRERTIPTE